MSENIPLLIGDKSGSNKKYLEQVQYINSTITVHTPLDNTSQV